MQNDLSKITQPINGGATPFSTLPCLLVWKDDGLSSLVLQSLPAFIFSSTGDWTQGLHTGLHSQHPSFLRHDLTKLPRLGLHLQFSCFSLPECHCTPGSAWEFYTFLDLARHRMKCWPCYEPLSFRIQQYEFARLQGPYYFHRVTKSRQASYL